MQVKSLEYLLDKEAIKIWNQEVPDEGKILAVQELLSSITPAQLQICEHLMNGMTITETSKALNIRRETIYGQIKRCIRPKLDYLLRKYRRRGY